MAKPTVIPTWATSGTITTPPASRIATGYQIAARFRAQYANWLQSKTNLWLSWLDGLFGADGTLTIDSGGDVVLAGDGKYKHAALWQKVANDGVVAGTAATETTQEIPLKVGDVLTAFRAGFFGNNAGTASFTVALKRYSDPGSPTTIESFTVSGVFDVWTSATVTLTTPYTVVDNEAIYVSVTPSVTTQGTARYEFQFSR